MLKWMEQGFLFYLSTHDNATLMLSALLKSASAQLQRKSESMGHL